MEPCENISLSLIHCNPSLSLIQSDFALGGPSCDVDQKAELLRALTIEIFSESKHDAEFREEFFALCMEIKFLSDQKFGKMCLTCTSKRAV